MFYIIVVSIITYIGMIVFTKHRTSISFIGSGLLLMLGSVTNIFDADKAFLKFPGEIVILINVCNIAIYE